MELVTLRGSSVFRGWKGLLFALVNHDPKKDPPLDVKEVPGDADRQ